MYVCIIYLYMLWIMLNRNSIGEWWKVFKSPHFGTKVSFVTMAGIPFFSFFFWSIFALQQMCCCNHIELYQLNQVFMWTSSWWQVKLCGRCEDCSLGVQYSSSFWLGWCRFPTKVYSRMACSFSCIWAPLANLHGRRIINRHVLFSLVSPCENSEVYCLF